MSGYAWDLSGTDAHCASYRPGHMIHWIHFNHSMRQPGPVTPVSAAVDDDGLVHIEGEDLSLLRWNHRPAVIRDALHRFGGMAVWKPRWHILAVPTEAVVGGARTVFNLVPLDQRCDCYVARATDTDRPLLPGVPSATDGPLLRVAVRYATGRPRPHSVESSGREGNVR
jgi:hypothetical protein